MPGPSSHDAQSRSVMSLSLPLLAAFIVPAAIYATNFLVRHGLSLGTGYGADSILVFIGIDFSLLTMDGARRGEIINNTTNYGVIFLALSILVWAAMIVLVEKRIESGLDRHSRPKALFQLAIIVVVYAAAFSLAGSHIYFVSRAS